MGGGMQEVQSEDPYTSGDDFKEEMRCRVAEAEERSAGKFPTWREQTQSQAQCRGGRVMQTWSCSPERAERRAA